MSIINLTKALKARFAAGAVILALSLSALMSFASPVLAQTGTTPQVTPAPRVQKTDEALVKAYQREQDALKKQADNLSKITAMTAKAQALIDQAKTKQIDPTALEQALATFKSQVTVAQSSHDTAGQVLASHSGFDANGSVTDRTAARQTVLDAKQSITDARRELVQAAQDLRSALKDWRAGNREKARDAVLAKSYQREQTWLTTQQTNLTKASDAASKAQALIDQAKAKGVDTAALDQALATFQSQMATAAKSHAAAQASLSSHSGFDASGKVTDAAAAQQTVKDARQSLMDAHTVLTQAVKDLHNVVKDWRAAHKGSTATATPAVTQ